MLYYRLMPKLKRFFLSLLVLLLLVTFNLSLFAPAARAQEAGSWYNQNFQEWYTKVYDEDTSLQSEIFGERYTAAQVQWVIYGLISFILNAVTDPETTACLMNNDLTDCTDQINGFLSELEESNQALASDNKGFVAFMLADRPLSGITYAKNLVRKFGVIPTAVAQEGTGFGFNALDPILPLWRAVRNAAYGLVVIVTLAMAFMIMFRVKVSPQTVISIQSALPKIATAIFLITFSYAIAGLLVDLMYVVIGFFSVIISSAIGSATGLNTSGGIGGGIAGGGAIFGFLTQGVFGFGAMGLFVLFMFLFSLVIFPVLFFINGGVGALVGEVLTLGALHSVVMIFSLIVIVIVFIMLLFTGIKTFWMLFKAFANALLLVLVAPFQILLGTVSPGGGFGGWLRSYMANLAVFPTVGILFVLSYIFLILALRENFTGFFPDSLGGFFTQIGLGLPATSGIAAAAQHQGWPPLLVFPFQNSAALLFAGVSVVIIFIIPRTIEMIKALVEGKPFAYGTAIGEAFGPIAWGGKQAWNNPAVRAIREYGTLDSALGIMQRIESSRWYARQREGSLPQRAFTSTKSSLERAQKPTGSVGSERVATRRE